jgi:hypothetical protein
VNDVGRPDLRDADEDPSALAASSTDSLHTKSSPSDEVKVYPAHGAGRSATRHFPMPLSRSSARNGIELGDADQGPELSSLSK